MKKRSAWLTWCSLGKKSEKNKNKMILSIILKTTNTIFFPIFFAKENGAQNLLLVRVIKSWGILMTTDILQLTKSYVEKQDKWIVSVNFSKIPSERHFFNSYLKQFVFNSMLSHFFGIGRISKFQIPSTEEPRLLVPRVKSIRKKTDINGILDITDFCPLCIKLMGHCSLLASICF